MPIVLNAGVFGVDFAALHTRLINWKSSGKFSNLFADALLDFGIANVGQNVGDPVADLLHLPFAHPTGGHRGAAQADSPTFHGRQGIERNGILVHGDARAVQSLFGVVPGNPRECTSIKNR